MVQSDIDDQAFQVQRILADELDQYKERGNSYVDNNIQEIQELYIDKEQQEKSKGKVEEEEVIRSVIGECLHNVHILEGKLVSVTTDGFITNIKDLETEILKNPKCTVRITNLIHQTGRSIHWQS